MKRSWVSWVFFVGVVAALVLATGDVAEAQVRMIAPGEALPSAKANVARIRRLPKLGRSSEILVRTPEFQTSLGRSSRNRKPRSWAMFEIEYETAPEWLDALDLAYSVMTYTKGKDGKDAYSLFQLRVTYLDIEKGEHTGCVVLAPNTLARFGQPVAVAVEVYQDGTLLASDTTIIDTKLPATDWWKNPVVIDNPIVARREGLMERSKTPFALINMDDYEVVK